MESKTLSEQIQIFKDRGMIFGNEDFAKKKLTHINYYKLKEYSLPFMNNGKYFNITFEELIDIFYLDRALRVNLIHNIEKIEISLKTQLAKVLGKYGSYSYLNFNVWVDKNEYCKYYIKEQEKKFKDQILKNLSDRSNEIIKNFQKENPDIKEIPIWMLVETLTLGETINLFKLLSPNLKKKIAKSYRIPSETILESWLYKIKLIRNLCAHNIKVYDIQFFQKTKTLTEWKDIGIDYNKLPLILAIIQHLTLAINPFYRSRTLKCIKVFLQRYPARREALGLRSMDSLTKLMKYKVEEK